MTTITNVVFALPIQGDDDDTTCVILHTLNELSRCDWFESSQFSAQGLELLHHQGRSCVARHVNQKKLYAYDPSSTTFFMPRLFQTHNAYKQW